MSEQHAALTPQEIVVIHRAEDRTRGRWDDVEQLAKVLSIVAIPVVVAVVGWRLQDSLSKRTVSQEYVSLAVSILKEKESDAGLRAWAVDLLNSNSPTQFAPEVSQRLRKGVLRLPVSASLRRAMAATDAEQIVREIVDAAGLVPNFTLQVADVPSAAAMMHDGKRVLLYSPAFIQSVNRDAGTNWAAVAVLAHEIGHHLLGHTLAASGTSPEVELEADSFSGFMLSRLGATLDEAVAVSKMFPEEPLGPHHPGRAKRAGAIRDGWQRAQSGGTTTAPGH